MVQEPQAWRKEKECLFAAFIVRMGCGAPKCRATIYHNKKLDLCFIYLLNFSPYFFFDFFFSSGVYFLYVVLSFVFYLTCSIFRDAS